MSSTPRRAGFRLPWSSAPDEGEQPTDAGQSTQATADAARGAPAEEGAEDYYAESNEMAAAVEDETAVEPTPQAPARPTTAAGEAGPPQEFMQSLVEAMRTVADESRTTTLEQLRMDLADRIAELHEHAATRAEELRHASDSDQAAIGTWQEAEIERVRAEAERKAEARHQQLEQQLTDNSRRTETAIGMLTARVNEYERELDTFFTSLSSIGDPYAFVAAAKRMPRSPVLSASAAAPVAAPEAQPAVFAGAPAPESVQAVAQPVQAVEPEVEPEAERVPQPEPEPVAAEPGPVPVAVETEPVSATVEPEPEAMAAAEPEAETTETEAEMHEEVAAEDEDSALAQRLSALDAMAAQAAQAAGAGRPESNGSPAAEVATAVVVKGLGSFGAITTFKQSIERLNGVRSVALSLGPTGEFVYRAVHEANYDLSDALRKLEPGSEVERQADGTLRLTIQRSR